MAWDGTGYGTDGTIWGGEFFGRQRRFHARCSSTAFPLRGRGTAAREPRRSLLGLLFALYRDVIPRDRLHFTPNELNLLLAALYKSVNAPLTSSMGRLFDGVAALAGLFQMCSFEGQAAMALEYAALRANTDECYPFEITHVTNTDYGNGCMIEWKSMLTAILSETDSAMISAKFHNTLAAIEAMAAERIGVSQVALTGGCFQNRVLWKDVLPNCARQASDPTGRGNFGGVIKEISLVYVPEAQVGAQMRRSAFFSILKN